MNKKIWTIPAAAAAVGGVYLLNRYAHRLGASQAEIDRPLPGDEIIANPNDVTNHGVTIQAPPTAVWPWLVQAGYHRGGWYGNDAVEEQMINHFFRRIVPADKKPEFRPSAERILPEFQNLAVGGIVPDGPAGSAFFTVKELVPEQHLVLYSDSHMAALAPPALAGTQFAPYGDFTWVFSLDQYTPGVTRLQLRTRGRYGPALFRPLFWPFLLLSETLFPYWILQGMKERAERPVTDVSG